MAIVDWCYDAVDYCRFSRETVAVAMDMVDRYLSRPSTFGDEVLRDRNKFQLLSVTAMYVAIKVNEPVAMTTDIFVKICRGFYTVEEIEDMELKLLNGISWLCNAPTANQVGLSILSLLLPLVDDIQDETRDFLMDEMKYLVELSVRDYYFSTQRSSAIALATIFNAIAHIQGQKREELLEASLCIIERFDFDEAEVVETISKKLQQQRQQQESHDEGTEASVDGDFSETSEFIEISSLNSIIRQLQVNVRESGECNTEENSSRLDSERSPLSVCDVKLRKLTEIRISIITKSTAYTLKEITRPALLMSNIMKVKYSKCSIQSAEGTTICKCRSGV
jgi:hypothetical protein